MSREGIQSREENIRLYDAGVLQDLLERSSSGGSIGSGKKALKRMRKEEKETARQEKTLAKLEMRNQEREKKEERKEKKKAREAESARAPGAVVASLLGLDTKAEESIVEAVAQRLFTSPKTSSSKVVEEETESRYSIADSSRKPKAVDVIFIESDDSSMDGGSDEEDRDGDDDDDVIIGGTGGDQLTGGRDDDSSEEEEEEEDSNDEVSRHLVEVGRGIVLESEAVIVTSGKTEAEKKIRKDKIVAKTAFWRAKSGKKMEVLDLSD